MTKKIYVTSGQLRVVLAANSPQDAIKKALRHASQKVLDSKFFYLDERGFRGADAEYKVPVEQALAEAGYVFEDGNKPRLNSAEE